MKIENEDKEYIIDRIEYKKDYHDYSSVHLCLICRDGGQGEIRR